MPSKALTYLGLHHLLVNVPVEVCRAVDGAVRSDGLVRGSRLRVPASTEVILVLVSTEVNHLVHVYPLPPGPLRHGQHVVPHLPPGHGRHCARLARPAHVAALLLHGREVPGSKDRPPPDGGHVHVLFIVQPDVHHVGLIELAGEGHLALVEGVGLAHLHAVKQVGHPAHTGQGGSGLWVREAVKVEKL